VNPDQVFAIIIGSIAAWTIARVFRGPLGEALARRIGGTAGQAAVREDDHQVAELQARLAELEERLDFTERVLLQERSVGEIDRGTAR
jgi:tetrahydromethanopterin S-methyltransferase subunit G